MSSRRRKEIPSIPVFSSSVASNSDVPAACLIHRIYDAALSNSEDLLIELEKAYLKGQSQKVVFSEAVQYAISTRRVCAIENLFKVDIGRVRQLTEKDVDVNALRPQVIDRAIQGKKTDVDILKLFLDLGLNIRKVFGGFGDALMFAVRIGRWELIERILMQRGSFNVDKVKYHKYGNAYTLLSVAGDRLRIGDQLRHYGALDAEETPIWAEQKRIILTLLDRGANIKGTCLLPNLAADPQRKGQAVSFACLLIEEYDADVSERYGWDMPIHRRRTREAISTPIYEAVRNNFPEMVTLLLDKGADATVSGHRGMTLMECAWRNKHGGMVELLREKGVPEGPTTKDKHLSMLHDSSPARAPALTPRRTRAERHDRLDPDSSDDEYPGEWHSRMYQAILP